MHFSAQRNHMLWDTLGGFSDSVTKKRLRLICKVDLCNHHQGLTLVHYSAQCKHLLWDTGGLFQRSSDQKRAYRCFRKLDKPKP